MKGTISFHMFGYRLSYYLLRPWKVVRELWWGLVYFCQRGLRGWADCDTWNMDCYLAEVIVPMLLYLAKTSHGSPASFDLDMHSVGENDAWKAYLQELSVGFSDYLKARDGSCCYQLSTYTPILERMRRLFDYYPSLWS